MMLDHHQYADGLGTPRERLNFELRALENVLAFSEYDHQSPVPDQAFPEYEETYARLRWIVHFLLSDYMRHMADPARAEEITNLRAAETFLTSLAPRLAHEDA
jgi:hypothetical protein